VNREQSAGGLPTAAPNFDRLARAYAVLEWLSFGRALATRRTHYIADPRLSAIRRALVLGDGDGRFTAALLAHNPSLHVTAVDASAAMLGELRRRVASSTPNATLDLCCADLRTWAPADAQYDLVTAHFFFDCLTTSEVAALVARLAPALTPNARWLVSDFSVPARGIAAPFARLLVRALYFAFAILTGLRVKALPDYESALESANFSAAGADTALGGALRSEIWVRGRA
jgi:ubiquinone/menaquinone biosynthesis C-methylase UbiE